MTLEAFKKVISLLKKESEKTGKLYKLGLDLFNFNDDLQQAISIMFKSHYSEEGEDFISWWLWEDGRKVLFDKDDNVVNDLTRIEDLWAYVEEIRKSTEFKEYVPVKKKKMAKKQMEKMFGNMFGLDKK